MKTSQPQIFVGCGGTGIRTLTRLNRLLAQDEHWRRRLARDIYYIVLDTNQGELDEFERNIGLDCGKALPPKVITISLGQGFQSIWPIMNDKFVRPFSEEGTGNKEGKSRLEQHFWHQGGAPFSADKVRVLRTGAGQCPPVSYFLSWYNMHGPIEHAFHELVDAIIKRRSTSGQDPLQNVNFHVVAGLAGGTGRGCWELVSLYLRDLFARQGAKQVTPFAYLLDASCFRQVYRGKEAQEVQMKTNSLTGLSQLSTWITDRKNDAFYEFRLPSMDAPHDPDQDVIRIDRNHDKVGDRPVQKAFVVCGGNSHATLDRSDDFKDMLGTALYTTLYTVGRGDSIAANQSNEPQPLYSLGAATVEVEAVKIRRFAEEQLRKEFARRLAHLPPTEMDEARKTEIAKSTLTKMRFTAGRRDEDIAATAYSLLKNTQGVHHPNTAKARLVDLLQDCNDLDEAVDAAHKAIALPASDASKLLDGAFKRSDKLPEDVLRETYLDWLEATGSLRVVAERLRAVAETLEKDTSSGASGKIGDSFKNYILEMGRRPWYLVGKRFSSEELEELNQQFEPEYHRPAALAVLREALQERKESVARQARQWASSAEALANSAKRLVNTFDSSARAAAELGEDQDPMDVVFFDPATPEKALPGIDGARRFYKRVLRPCRPESLLDLLAEGVGMEHEVVNLLADAIQSVDIKDIGALRNFEQSLEACLKKQVNAQPAAIEKSFSLRGVADDHARAWENRFHGLVNDPDTFENLAHEFSQFYGFRPERPADGQERFSLFPESMRTGSSGEELLLRMGVDLAAHCHSYWTVNESGNDMGHEEINLFLPSMSDSGKSSSDERFKDAASAYYADLVDGTSKRPFHAALSGNKYVAVAYAASGTDSFDAVQSFAYWREDSRVTKNLQEAEKTDGDLIFDDAQSNGGLGFTSPIYVRDQQIAENRWRPWFKPSDGAANSERERGIQALAYALLEVEDGRLREGWPLPLLAADEKGGLTFQREELFYDEHDDRPSNAVKICLDDPQWKPGDQLAVGVHRALALLSGDRVDGPMNANTAIQIRGRIIEEELEYWNDYAKRKQFGRMSRAHADILENMAKLSHARGQDAASRGQAKDAETWAELRSHYNTLAREARAELNSQG
ncbi:tubulin-like doman-containing protein [Planctomycetota bacterium]|nr:tubulin-like doman-containing protein [Planctomycetota bacterium]